MDVTQSRTQEEAHREVDHQHRESDDAGDTVERIIDPRKGHRALSVSAFRFGMFQEPPSHCLGKPFALRLAERPPSPAVRPLACERFPPDSHL